MVSHKMRYLQRLNGWYYARVRVPASLEATVGNTHLRKALGTQDLAKAQQLKWPIVNAFKAYLDGLKSEDPEHVRAIRFREDVRKALKTGNVEYAETLAMVATDEAEKIYEETGNLSHAQEWAHIATGGETLLELADRWLASKSYTEQTKKQHRHAVNGLIDFIGGSGLLGSMKADTPIDYVNHFQSSSQSYATQRRKLNSLIGFWDWLALEKVVPRGNPWRGFRLSASNKNGSKLEESKRPYTDSELLQIFARAPDYPGLSDVMVLGLYTGARQAELCSLTCGTVEQDSDGVWWLDIKRAKTKAGNRRIAVVHSIPVSVLQRRVGAKLENSDLLFSELSPGGYDGKLSWSLSKAFGRHRTKMGLNNAVDYHSFRRTFITALENLGVDAVRIARYVGHKLPTLALSLYSGGATPHTQLETARVIQYPKRIEEDISQFIEQSLTGPKKQIRVNRKRVKGRQQIIGRDAA